MIYNIKHKLGIGSVNLGNHFVRYTVSKKNDLLKIFQIFEDMPLNITKNLNLLDFKNAYYLCHNRREIISNVIEEILKIKNTMNRKRSCFEQPKEYQIIISAYWLLDFIESEGYFCINNKTGLDFGLGQSKIEYLVLESIKNFLFRLLGIYYMRRSNSKFVRLFTDMKAKNIRSQPLTKLSINDFNYIKLVLVPFLDKLTWFSKKELDYKDWKIVLEIIHQGKQFSKEGQELIFYINKRMNTIRLSINLPFVPIKDIEMRINNLLNAPSNYKLSENGKVFIISEGRFLRERGNIEIELYTEDKILVKLFKSIKDSAKYFNTSERTINRRLDSRDLFVYEGQKFFIKRVNKLP